MERITGSGGKERLGARVLEDHGPEERKDHDSLERKDHGRRRVLRYGVRRCFRSLLGAAESGLVFSDSHS
jgi:hypothetical protein